MASEELNKQGNRTIMRKNKWFCLGKTINFHVFQVLILTDVFIRPFS